MLAAAESERRDIANAKVEAEKTLKTAADAKRKRTRTQKSGNRRLGATRRKKKR
jgi:hypothetical protein